MKTKWFVTSYAHVLASLAQASIKVGEVVVLAGALVGRVHGVAHDALGRS
jgi:hypothetical protein